MALPIPSLPTVTGAVLTCQAEIHAAILLKATSHCPSHDGGLFERANLAAIVAALAPEAHMIPERHVPAAQMLSPSRHWILHSMPSPCGTPIRTPTRHRHTIDGDHDDVCGMNATIGSSDVHETAASLVELQSANTGLDVDIVLPGANR